MTRDKFKSILKEKNYHFTEEGDKIIISHYTNVYLDRIESIPENVIFNNKASVYLNSLKTIPEGVEFRNEGSVNLKRLPLSELREGVFFNSQSFWCDEFNNINWEIYIEASKSRIFNLMIKRGIFIWQGKNL